MDARNIIASKTKQLAAGKNEKHKKQNNSEVFSTHIKLPLPGVS